MRREWEPEELIACWTLVEGDAALIGNKSGPTRLGFALLLKFFELEGRFPRHVGELPEPAVRYMAQQLGVDAADLASCDWSGRTIKYHRAQIREANGFREATRGDEEHLSAWLNEEVYPVELSETGCEKPSWPGAGPITSNRPVGLSGFSPPPARPSTSAFARNPRSPNKGSPSGTATALSKLAAWIHRVYRDTASFAKILGDCHGCRGEGNPEGSQAPSSLCRRRSPKSHEVTA